MLVKEGEDPWMDCSSLLVWIKMGTWSLKWTLLWSDLYISQSYTGTVKGIQFVLGL